MHLYNLNLFIVLCSLRIDIIPTALALVSLLQQRSWSSGTTSRSFGIDLFLCVYIILLHVWWLYVKQVMDVPSTSPLYGYLAPGDVILSVDNVPTKNAQEWLKLNTLTYDIQLKSVNISQHTGDLAVLNDSKGYCVPSLVMEASKITGLLENQHVCPSELNAFVKISCSDNITLDDGQSETDLSNGRWNMYCLNAKDVVKLDKCGDGWGLATSNGSSCTCSQVDNYLTISNLCSLSLHSMHTEYSLDIFHRMSFV